MKPRLPELAFRVSHRHDDGVDELLEDDPDGADRIVVSGDGVVHDIWVGVGVDEGHDWDFQAAGFGNSDVLTGGVNDDQSVWQSVHGANATKVALELHPFAVEASEFLFGHGLELGLFLDFLEVIEAGNAFADGFHVGEHATEPAVIDVELSAGFCCFTNGFLGLAFATDEEDLLLLAGQFTEELGSDVDLFDGFLDIEDVDLVPGFQDERLHLGVPTAGLVAEVDSGFDEFGEDLI